MRLVKILLGKVRTVYHDYRLHHNKEQRNKTFYTYNISDMPDDFPHFKIRGESAVKEDILITPHSSDFESGYLIITDYKGKIKNYKKLDSFAYAFRKFLLPDGKEIYAYLQTEGREDRQYERTFLNILDENLNPIKENIRPILNGGPSKYSQSFCDAHDYIILGLNHYILFSFDHCLVKNIPGYEGKTVKVFNTIIQEQKDGQVLFQFESVEHPELYSAAYYQNDYNNFGPDKTCYADYTHLNSIAIDPVTKDLLCSFRSIGLVKISRETGRILWIMGHNRNDIRNVEKDMLGTYQHDAQYQKDGSITVFDNNQKPRAHSRVCRYWIDEDCLTLTKFKEYVTNIPYSEYMGGAQLVDSSTDTFKIAYGGDLSFIGFEEYDFSNRRQNMKLVFKDGHDLYQVFSGEIDVKEQ